MNAPLSVNFTSAQSAPCLPLEVQGLRRSYRTGKAIREAVRGVTFSIAQGECLGLLGPNGAGKSSTMNCLTGFHAMDAGSVRILGHCITTAPRRARRELGVCNQEDTLDTDFTVLAQMVRYGTYFGLSVRESTVRAHVLLEQMGLADRRDELVETLSGGMRRRLQVARALIHRPRLLILDEPSTGLDPEIRRELWEVIHAYKADGGAVLLSTHYMEEAQRLCDRVALMHEGQFLDVATPERLIEKYCGSALVEECLRPGLVWQRPPHLEDAYLRLTGRGL